MERYKRKFTEIGVLSGKSKTGFKGVDEIGGFWVVTKPTKSSELDDIFFEADILDIHLQINGGLKGSDIVGFYKSSSKAKKIAQDLLERVK